MRKALGGLLLGSLVLMAPFVTLSVIGYLFDEYGPDHLVPPLIGDQVNASVRIRNQTDLPVILKPARDSRWPAITNQDAVTLEPGESVVRAIATAYAPRTRPSDSLILEATNLTGDPIFCRRVRSADFSQVQALVQIRAGQNDC